MNGKASNAFQFFICALSRMNFRRRQECATILRWLNPQPGENILDVGCGDGYYNSLISKTGAKVTGIDIHEKRLAVAKNHYQNERTEFRYMNAEEMDFPDETFDKVMSLCVVEHLHHDDQVIRHISRVLKNGGRFVFSADSLSNPGLTEEERARHQKRYAVNTFYNMENIKEKLFRAGLEIEKARYIMNTPFALRLTRLSWKLDDLPNGLGFVRVLGYLILGAVWGTVSLFPGEPGDHSRGGLTLLIISKKEAPKSNP